MKNKKTLNNRKVVILILSISVILVAAIGGTIAFLTDVDTPIKNVFHSSVVSSQVVEGSFNGTNKTNVSIKNTGDTTSYIRAAIVVTWKNSENGAVYARKPIAGSDYIITLNEKDWFLGNDGFYYYKEPVAKDDATNVLISTCSPVDQNTPEGYGLNVEILGSAIQSVPTRVVTTNWKVLVDDNGNLQK